MSIQKEFKALTAEQKKYVIGRYPHDSNREEFIYEISERTGRFLCRHRKPKHAFKS